MDDFYKLKLLWCLTNLLQMIITIDCKYIDDDCHANGTIGSCKLIENCPPLFNEIQSLAGSPLPYKLTIKLNHNTCGFENDESIVCCITQTKIDQSSIEVKDTPNRFRGEVDGVGLADVTRHPNFGLLPINCGTIESDRIIYGSITKLYEMPWMVFLLYESRSGIRSGCAGTLINEWYVLTAAHCVQNLTLIEVVLGEYDTVTDPDCEQIGNTKYCASPVQKRTLSKIIPHHGYKFRCHDIALLRLSQAANFSQNNLRPICLPSTQERQAAELTGLTGVTAGWGDTETTFSSSVLLSVKLPILSNADCEKAMGKQISAYQICAGGVEGKDSCRGDSGGPLIYPGPGQASRQVQRGILSYGPRECGTDGIPAVHTNVAYYMEWILDNIHK